ncbi:MAG: bifunctional nuclease family protein [Eggerthellaceae bacterium]|nr:bifunctional nuclease family protein [Eggerthellaceae bacterium]
MRQMSIQTLVVAAAPSPSILVLCPTEDYESQTSCRVVPIWLGPSEATLLGMALEGTRPARPLTHDLMLDALTNLDASVDRVEVYDVQQQTFFARLILRAGDRIVTLDARPSDAVALAVRQDAPIFMAEEVLGAASFPFVFRRNSSDEKELDEFHEFIQSLSPDDFQE